MTNQDVYKQGFIDGLKCFAWWKDGQEVCGTSEKPLKVAVSGVENLWNFKPPQEN